MPVNLICQSTLNGFATKLQQGLLQMATYTTRGKRVTAQIRLVGYPTESETFDTKREAKEWAVRREIEIKSIKQGKPLNYTLGQAIDKYITDVAPSHRGGDFEIRRLKAMAQTLPTARPLADFNTDFWNDWKQKRLSTKKQADTSKTISTGTVRREMCDITLVFEHARKELRWINANPLRDVTRPPQGKSRSRTISDTEVALMFKTLKYERGIKPISIGQQVGAMFDLALETGMRAGEVAGLTWDNVHLDKRFVHLPLTKNGRSRDVPLRRSAEAILDSMRGVNDDEVFAPSSSTMDAYFRKARKTAGLEGFTFHDARHTAATNIANTLKSSNVTAQQAVLDLCAIFGWTKIDQALTYYNPDVSDIADRMG